MKVEIGEYKDDNEERVVNIQIDEYDTWNMDSTLALIILPMLKQLKGQKQGSPFVDDEDVPPCLRGRWEDNMHTRWEYVLDAIIYSFTEYHNDDADKDRIQQGCVLFGKYFRNLWT